MALSAIFVLHELPRAHDGAVQVSGNRRLAIEVKGYPSVAYANPARASEVKSTQPASQARQLYSHALL